MGRLREHLEQLAPKLQEQAIPEDLTGIELDEQDILEAKRQKAARIRLARYYQEISKEPAYRKFTAEELKGKLLTSRTFNGKRYVIDKDNEGQVNALCMYFSGDPRLLDYGYSHDKGIFLMGGLGVGKTHLMSFFFQNQHASYVMASCRQIEGKWLNTKPDDQVDVIEYYSCNVESTTKPFGQDVVGYCFDDLGTETIPSKRFGEEKNVMAEIILGRYERRLDYRYSHFTTNLNREKLIALYGDRIPDRLKEMCNVIVFPDNSKSRR